MKQKIAVLYGGRSSEHEISIISALQAMEAIDPLTYSIMPVYVSLEGKWYTGDALYQKSLYTHFAEKKKALQEITLLPDPSIKGFVKICEAIDIKRPIKVDACLLMFHGQYGEDGCLQGLLELADIPYTGCRVAAAALAMNKTLSKKIAEAEGVPVVPYLQVKREEARLSIDTVTENIEETFNGTYPLFVKPVHLGSSIAISRAYDRESLKSSLAKVFQFDKEALVEKCITNILEINVSVMGKATSVVEIPIATDGVLSYEDKYQKGGKGTGSEGMASLSRIIDPQDLNPNIKEEVQKYALKLFSAFGAAGLARFDFIFDKDLNQLYFNEINPLPGSLAFYLWEKTEPRVLYPDIIRHLLEGAFQKQQEKESLLPIIGFKVLR